jgi:hypothetical protein
MAISALAPALPRRTVTPLQINENACAHCRDFGSILAKVTMCRLPLGSAEDIRVVRGSEVHDVCGPLFQIVGRWHSAAKDLVVAVVRVTVDDLGDGVGQWACELGPGSLQASIRTRRRPLAPSEPAKKAFLWFTPIARMANSDVAAMRPPSRDCAARGQAERDDVQPAICWSNVRQRFYQGAAAGPAPIAGETPSPPSARARSGLPRRPSANRREFGEEALAGAVLIDQLHQLCELHAEQVDRTRERTGASTPDLSFAAPAWCRIECLATRSC